MRCLWLTLADPDPPLDGQAVYSGGLIRACAKSGADVVVLGLCAANGPRRDEREDNVRWRIQGKMRSHWASMTTALPHTASRCFTPELRETLDRSLAEEEWDAIVFDSISAAWALPAVDRRYRGMNGATPRIVYISHNHEASLRESLAHNRKSITMRQAHRFDALKTRRLEQAVVKSADLVTAITEQDAAIYRAEWPEKWIEVLSPGYSGRTLAERRITHEVPRRVVIIGSFEWIAKRMNLEEFLRVADPIFASQGIELTVVGAGDPSYFHHLEQRLCATKFTGKVERIEDFIDDARIAVLPERIGGGFKLKLLEYVFNRIPVLGIKGSAAGTPLREDASVMLFSDQAALARGVTALIDNLGRLNALQNAAFAACRNAFDWESRGKRLVAALGSL